MSESKSIICSTKGLNSIDFMVATVEGSKGLFVTSATYNLMVYSNKLCPKTLQVLTKIWVKNQDTSSQGSVVIGPLLLSTFDDDDDESVQCL